MTAATAPLAAREAYRLWAASYDEENPVTALEDRCVRELTPPLGGRWLLDAACGTGRRIPRTEGRGPRRVTGVDFVYEMLGGARARADIGAPGGRARLADLAAADLRALPFPSRSFDVIWCRLAVGHLAELGDVYHELARVARSDAHIIITDFHPRAAIAGHLRSFRDTRGRKHIVEHFVHDIGAHLDAAGTAGLKLEERREPAVGRAVRPFYAAAGKLDAYEQQRGLPLVLALAYLV